MNDMYFWLGGDGEVDLVSSDAFAALQNGARERSRKWRELDTAPATSYYFYGVIEPIEDEDLEANGDWNDLLDYSDEEPA